MNWFSVAVVFWCVCPVQCSPEKTGNNNDNSLYLYSAFHNTNTELFVNVTLHWCGISWNGNGKSERRCVPLWREVSTLRTGGVKERVGISFIIFFPISLRLRLTLVWSRLIDIFLAGHDPGFRVQGCRFLQELQEEPRGPSGGHSRTPPCGRVKGTGGGFSLPECYDKQHYTQPRK